MTATLIVGSRASKLALAQTRFIADRLSALHPAARIEIRHISTEGDRVLDRALGQFEGKGVFVTEIEHALLAGEIDLAVHSLKDLPTEPSAGLVIAAIPDREDPRDALATRDGRPLESLPAGARVGSSSLRRALQLRALRPDLVIADIRGNVDTRLRKLDEGQYDAIVLAAAGLARLGLLERVAQFFDPQAFLPAPGQGALAVQARADDEHTQALLAPLEHLPTRMAVTAERSFLQALGGGCQVPVGAYARVEGDEFALDGFLAGEDGADLRRATLRGPSAQAPVQAAALGARLAARIREPSHGRV
jgi:hydroxymethylbilane synthase